MLTEPLYCSNGNILARQAALSNGPFQVEHSPCLDRQPLRKRWTGLKLPTRLSLSPPLTAKNAQSQQTLPISNRKIHYTNSSIVDPILVVNDIGKTEIDVNNSLTDCEKKKKKKRAENGPETIKSHCSERTEYVECAVCGGRVRGDQPVGAFLSHSKQHNIVKQFHCIQCRYSKNIAARVRHHMKLSHGITDQKPLDFRSRSLQEAWINVAIKCFPSFAQKLSNFRFRKFR